MIVGPPPVPVTVKLNVPIVLLPTVILSMVEVPLDGFGVNEVVEPEGAPLMLNVTGELKPFVLLIVTV